MPELGAFRGRVRLVEADDQDGAHHGAAVAGTHQGGEGVEGNVSRAERLSQEHPGPWTMKPWPKIASPLATLHWWCGDDVCLEQCRELRLLLELCSCPTRWQ